MIKPQGCSRRAGTQPGACVPVPVFMPLGSSRAGENSAPDASFLGVSAMSWGERFSLYFPILGYDLLVP